MRLRYIPDLRGVGRSGTMLRRCCPSIKEGPGLRATKAPARTASAGAGGAYRTWDPHVLEVFCREARASINARLNSCMGADRLRHGAFSWLDGLTTLLPPTWISFLPRKFMHKKCLTLQTNC